MVALKYGPPLLDRSRWARRRMKWVPEEIGNPTVNLSLAVPFLIFPGCPIPLCRGGGYHNVSIDWGFVGFDGWLGTEGHKEIVYLSPRGRKPLDPI